MTEAKVIARLEQRRSRRRKQTFEITDEHSLRVDSVTEAKHESFVVPLRLINPNPSRLENSVRRLIIRAWLLAIGGALLLSCGFVTAMDNPSQSAFEILFGILVLVFAALFGIAVQKRRMNVLSFTAATGARLPLWFNNPNRAEFEKFVEQLKAAIEVAQKAQPTNLSLSAELVRLKELFDEGTLDKEQFEAAKNRLLGNEPQRRVGF